MNKRLLFNNILAISLPSIAVFSTLPALALVQLPVPSLQNQQVTIPQSSAKTITLSRAVKFDTAQRRRLPTTDFLTQPYLISSGVGVVAPSGVNYNNEPSDGNMQTPDELRPASSYYQTPSGNLQQAAPNIQTKLQHPWQELHWSNGYVCRERSADTVCLTPQEATNLRWTNPSR